MAPNRSGCGLRLQWLPRRVGRYAQCSQIHSPPPTCAVSRRQRTAKIQSLSKIFLALLIHFDAAHFPRPAELDLQGSYFETAGNLLSISKSQAGFRCIFTKPSPDGKKESLYASFDARYSDLITSWRVGQSISLIGTVTDVRLFQSPQSKEPLSIDFELIDCVPKK
jgi:hypothetical protein